MVRVLSVPRTYTNSAQSTIFNLRASLSDWTTHKPIKKVVAVNKKRIPLVQNKCPIANVEVSRQQQQQQQQQQQAAVSYHLPGANTLQAAQ